MTGHTGQSDEFHYPEAWSSVVPQGANQRWSLDFLSDAFADGRRFRILAVVDDFTRECLALVPYTSLPALRVLRELDVIIAWRGRPAMSMSDNGSPSRPE
jgi:putative transposase